MITLYGIRAALARGGVSGPALSVTHLSGQRSRPRLADPADLRLAAGGSCRIPAASGRRISASSDYKKSASNEPYWNFGCASQATLAAQVADPIDLVRARAAKAAPTPPSGMGAIGKLREGKDPSTQYRQQTPQINSTVGGR